MIRKSLPAKKHHSRGRTKHASSRLAHTKTARLEIHPNLDRGNALYECPPYFERVATQINDCSQPGRHIGLWWQVEPFKHTSGVLLQNILWDINYPRHQRRSMLIGYLQRHLTGTTIAFEEKELNSRGRQEHEIDVATDTPEALKWLRRGIILDRSLSRWPLVYAVFLCRGAFKSARSMISFFYSKLWERTTQ